MRYNDLDGSQRQVSLYRGANPRRQIELLLFIHLIEEEQEEEEEKEEKKKRVPLSEKIK